MTVPRLAAIVAALAMIMPHSAFAIHLKAANETDEHHIERPIGLLLQTPETPTGKPLHGDVTQASGSAISPQERPSHPAPHQMRSDSGFGDRTADFG